MGKTKHEKSYVDFDRPYEANIIGMRGIIYFGVGLFLLIVITFVLIWVLQYWVLEDQANEADRQTRLPMAMSKEEQLPPEPRLQAAPGFGVEGPGGNINLELKNPQAEYEQLHAQWEKLWKEGQKVVGPNGQETVVILPIEEAKKKFLEEYAKARGGEKEQKALEEARTIVSASSAGRTATDIRR